MTATDKCRLKAQMGLDLLDKIKDRCIYYTIYVMVLEDLKDKTYLINTVIPILYWANNIGTENFVFKFPFFMFILGIIFAAIQLHFLERLENWYEHKFGRKKITIDEFPYVVPTIKQNRIIIYSGVMIWIYGLFSFIFMIMNENKNEVVWLLIAFYSIGLLYIVFKVVYVLKNNFFEIFITGLHWLKK